MLDKTNQTLKLDLFYNEDEHSNFRKNVFDLKRRLLTLNTLCISWWDSFLDKPFWPPVKLYAIMWLRPDCNQVCTLPRSINENQEEKTSKIIRVANYLQNQNEIMFFVDNRTLKILANFKRIKHGIILGANDQPRFTTKNHDFATIYTWLLIINLNTWLR